MTDTVSSGTLNSSIYDTKLFLMCFVRKGPLCVSLLASSCTGSFDIAIMIVVFWANNKQTDK